MHMADALISPEVGGAMWAVTAGVMAWCARKVKETRDDRLIPMMGVLGAFIFTAQMLNFSIPVTGSSGHLGGGLILAVLLGPYAAFLVIASVLTVQALFFADGGLLALGCNIFNLGFAPAFIAYPLLYKWIAGKDRVGARAWAAAMVAAIVGLQLGAFGVVVETRLSGISELPFEAFVLIMQPIHLAIGIVEGLATAVVVAFVARARPEALEVDAEVDRDLRARSVDVLCPKATDAARLVLRSEGTLLRRVVRSAPTLLIGFLIAATILGGVASWFASTHPDGLEWSIAKVTGKEEFAGKAVGVHEKLAVVQSRTAFLPDYGFGKQNVFADPVGSAPEPWPRVNAGTSVSGLVGGALVLVFSVLIGVVLRARGKPV
ncbi:MAG: energy-coupling factor ABC transporter permease [bacterium]